MLSQTTTSSLIDEPSQYKLRTSTRQRAMRTSVSSNKTTSGSDSDYSTSSTSQSTNKRSQKVSKNSNITSKKLKKQTPPEKRRVRTGCLTCRSKHKKCDEVKPICNFCQTKGLECIWPQEGMSRPAQLNDTLKQLLSLKKGISDDGAENFFLPIVPSFVSMKNIKLEPKYYTLPPNFPAVLSMLPALQSGDFSSNMNSFIFFNDKTVTSSKSTLFSQSLTNLLSNYFLTDPTHILHLSNPNHILSLSRESKSLTFAILAISSRLMEQVDPSYSGEHTLDFYLLSVRELSKYLRNEFQSIFAEGSVINKECIWWTVSMLTWFEMLSVEPEHLWTRLESFPDFCDTLTVLDDQKYSHVFCNFVLITYSLHLYTDGRTATENALAEKLSPDLIPEVDSNMKPIVPTAQMILQKLTTVFRKDVLNLTLQSFATKNNPKLWVDVWNSLLEWRMKLTGNEEYVQEDGSIILGVDRDLHNFILYHATCYILLSHKEENVSLVFQTPNDYTSIIAFAMYQDSDDYDDTMNWHRARLLKIMQSNMMTKTKKSTYATTACWFGCYVLNDDKSDNVQVKELIRNITSWCSLDIFKWLAKTYN